jgi:hypothetical protein
LIAKRISDARDSGYPRKAKYLSADLTGITS